MDVADRVQIAPLGYEYNRILKPIYEYNADTVVLLRHEAKQDYEASFQRDLVQTLRENDRIELKERECDLFDINSAVTAFVNVIEAHQKDDVLVNLSTGSKLTAIGDDGVSIRFRNTVLRRTQLRKRRRQSRSAFRTTGRFYW